MARRRGTRHRNDQRACFSPLAAAGGVDAGGQNIYVACTARHLAARGYTSTSSRVATARISLTSSTGCPASASFTFAQDPRGSCARSRCCRSCLNWRAQSSILRARKARMGHRTRCATRTSSCPAWSAQRLKRELGIPYVMTFHALGRVRRMHQPHDEFPPERCALEQAVIDTADAIVAECPQDERDLQRHYRTPASRIRMIPCGFDPGELAPVDRVEARERLGFRPAGRSRCSSAAWFRARASKR